jgi:hypothetical protein
MLEKVHIYKPFEDVDEKVSVRRAIKTHYKGLKFLSGDGLYHTRLVSTVMNKLSQDFYRQDWIADLSKPMASIFVEKCPSSVFNVVATARQLRRAVNKLVTEGEVSGKLETKMSLSNLFINEIALDDYLTLLVHLGILSVYQPTPGSTDHIFKISSGAYRERYLEVLLKSSLVELFAFETLEEVYDHGVGLIEDFLSTLSANSMTSLITWAAQHFGNNIMELHLQGYMVSGLYNELYRIATTQQETVLPNHKRTDITLQGKHVLVILELKKLNGSVPPTKTQKKAYHDELRGYVETKRSSVAGFIVAVYDGGRQYIVEKLVP